MGGLKDMDNQDQANEERGRVVRSPNTQGKARKHGSQKEEFSLQAKREGLGGRKLKGLWEKKNEFSEQPAILLCAELDRRVDQRERTDSKGGNTASTWRDRSSQASGTCGKRA